MNNIIVSTNVELLANAINNVGDGLQWIGGVLLFMTILWAFTRK